MIIIQSHNYNMWEHTFWQTLITSLDINLFTYYRLDQKKKKKLFNLYIPNHLWDRISFRMYVVLSSFLHIVHIPFSKFYCNDLNGKQYILALERPIISLYIILDYIYSLYIRIRKTSN